MKAFAFDCMAIGTVGACKWSMRESTVGAIIGYVDGDVAGVVGDGDVVVVVVAIVVDINVDVAWGAPVKGAGV